MTKTILLASVASLACINIASAQSVSLSSDDFKDDHSAHAHHDDSGHSDHSGHDHNAAPSAPVSIMGDHTHGAGEWMVSYRFSSMHMEDNRDGTDSLSPEDIATTYANRFSGIAGQPSTLRVVPTEMTMDMHMISAMYGITDRLTLMAMGMYMDNEMDHITFAGGAGTTRLGEFTTKSQGWGDTQVAALFKAYEHDNHAVNIALGLSVPTGSIKEEDNVLAPNGMTPRLRLPYAMQLGTGTYDLHPTITYTGHVNQLGWGAQYEGEIRLEDENSQGYAWGDKHGITGWGAYQWQNWISTSLRLTASTQEAIDGIDANIVAPVQTADPDNYGGERVEAGIGVNLRGINGWTYGHELGMEVTLPLYQDLNGPQLERDYAFTIGWSKAF